jgi:hypothetical protein
MVSSDDEYGYDEFLKDLYVVLDKYEFSKSSDAFESCLLAILGMEINKKELPNYGKYPESDLINSQWLYINYKFSDNENQKFVDSFNKKYEISGSWKRADIVKNCWGSKFTCVILNLSILRSHVLKDISQHIKEHPEFVARLRETSGEPNRVDPTSGILSAKFSEKLSTLYPYRVFILGAVSIIMVSGFTKYLQSLH